MKSQATSQRKIFGGASSEHIERLSAIPLLFDSNGPASSGRGRITDDSWQSAGQIGRRDVVDGHLRRVAFAAGAYRIELVAERRSHQWECVARVYHRGRAQHNLVLAVGRKRLASDSGGFFHWTSTHAARKLVLVSDQKHFALEPIRW